MRQDRLVRLAELKKVAEVGSEPVNLPPVNPPETKEAYIARASEILRAGGNEHEIPSLSSYYDSQVSGYGSGSSSKSTPAKTTVTTNSDVIDQQHRGKTLTDSAGYTYVTSTDGKSLTFSIKGSQPKTLNQSYKNWRGVVKNINAMPISASSGEVTAQTQATTPAAGEAPKKEEATKPNVRQFNANTIANVVAILQRAAKPGGMGLAVGSLTKDERGRIQKIIETINKVKPGIRSYDLLAKMIIATSGAEESFDGALGGENYSGQIASADRKDVVADRKGKGTFNKQVAFVLDYMNQFYDGEFSEDNEGTIKKFFADFTREIPAETPATPPANAQQGASQQPNVVMAPSTKDGGPVFENEEEKAKFEAKQKEFLEKQKKSSEASRIDPRIKKLATLRRLRVRSQMEAATSESAQFGRSRVS